MNLSKHLFCFCLLGGLINRRLKDGHKWKGEALTGRRMFVLWCAATRRGIPTGCMRIAEDVDLDDFVFGEVM